MGQHSPATNLFIYMYIHKYIFLFLHIHIHTYTIHKHIVRCSAGQNPDWVRSTNGLLGIFCVSKINRMLGIVAHTLIPALWRQADVESEEFENSQNYTEQSCLNTSQTPHSYAGIKGIRQHAWLVCFLSFFFLLSLCPQLMDVPPTS